MIAEFEALLNQRTELYKNKWDRVNRFSRWQKASRERQFRKLYPKRKMNLALIVLPPDRLKRWNEYSTKKWADIWHGREKAIEAQMELLAEKIDVPKSSEWFHCDTKSASSWHTQGFGACKYAENAAKNVTDHLNALGVETEIRATNHHVGGGSVSYCDFEVWAKTTKVGWEIAQMKPALSLVERVRLCWKRGSNPRVDMPFLPHGFEEANGLDYFGNYINEKNTAQKSHVA